MLCDEYRWDAHLCPRSPRDRGAADFLSATTGFGSRARYSAKSNLPFPPLHYSVVSSVPTCFRGECIKRFLDNRVPAIFHRDSNCRCHRRLHRGIAGRQFASPEEGPRGTTAGGRSAERSSKRRGPHRYPHASGDRICAAAVARTVFRRGGDRRRRDNSETENL